MFYILRDKVGSRHEVWGRLSDKILIYLWRPHLVFIHNSTGGEHEGFTLSCWKDLQTVHSLFLSIPKPLERFLWVIPTHRMSFMPPETLSFNLEVNVAAQRWFEQSRSRLERWIQTQWSSTFQWLLWPL